MQCITGDEIPFAQCEIDRLESRLWILDYLPKNCTGCELGVFRGHFTEKILEIAKPKKFYMVDPWTKLGESFGWRNPNSEYLGGGKLTTLYAYEDACRRVSRFGDIDIKIIEEYSEIFLSSLDARLDYIYLDTTHSYAGTQKELLLMDRVLNDRGFILGDDWWHSPSHVHHGVFRAVNEFIKTSDYQLVACGPGGQWIIRKSPNYSKA